MSAMQASASSKAQAEMDDRQAAIERESGAYKAQRQQDQINQVTGSQRAGFAANGVGLGGSSADTIADSTEQGALDVGAIRWNSKLVSDNYHYKAQMDSINADNQAMSAPLAFMSPVINSVAKYKSSFA